MSSPHRTSRTLALAALAVWLLAGCGGSKQHFSVRPSPLVSIFEAPVQLGSAPGPTLDSLRRLGVDDVRVTMRWSTIAPDPSARQAPAHFAGASPGAYPEANWTQYDRIVRAAAARKMGVLLNVSGPAPVWASGPHAPPGGEPGVWKPSAAQFARFVHAVGARYSGHYAPPGGGGPLPHVSFWSVWNEPNLGQANLAPQAIDGSRVESSALMYRALLNGAWASLQDTGHGRDTILIGELAPYGQTGPGDPGNFGEMAPLRFLRALYCVNSSLQPLKGRTATQRGCPTGSSAPAFARENPALFRASGFAIHPYANAQTTPPKVVLPGEPDFVYLATLPRLERFLDSVTSLYGAPRQLPLYSTEYGYFTNPPSSGAPSLALAAEYLNQAEYMSWRIPRLRSWDQYLLADPQTGGPSKFSTGLQFDTGQPKPIVFDAWRMPLFLPVTREQHGRGLEVWGDVRPAHYVSAPQEVRVELKPRGHGGFETVETVPVRDANGYFDTFVKFPSSGQIRLTWTYPHGPSIHSRLVAVTVA